MGNEWAPYPVYYFLASYTCLRKPRGDEGGSLAHGAAGPGPIGPWTCSTDPIGVQHKVWVTGFRSASRGLPRKPEGAYAEPL